MPEIAAIAGQGVIRGLVLHKLMEEILTGELAEIAREVERRAAELVEELASPGKDNQQLPDPTEIAQTVFRTLAIPEVALMRSTLLPEYPLYAVTTDALIAGRADAVAFADGRPAVVVDWKSDVNPAAADRQLYAGQVEDYMEALGAERGAIVYMSRGEIQWVGRGS